MVKASLPKVLLDKVQREDPDIGDHVYKKGPSLLEVTNRRALRYADEEAPAAPVDSPRTFEIDGREYDVPDWLITDQYIDDTLGGLKQGKEANVSLVRRASAAGSHLLAHKNYVSPDRRAFRRDQVYREGRKIFRSRDRKAIATGTDYGRRLMAQQWTDVEFVVMRKLWVAGAPVPFPVSFGAGLLMEYIGNEDLAAPRLVNARIGKEDARGLLEQILDAVMMFSLEGFVHGDLSAFNVLVWEGRAWIIDFPQAVDLSMNPHAIDLLRRDLFNVCNYFGKFGIIRDPDEVLARALAFL